MWANLSMVNTWAPIVLPCLFGLGLRGALFVLIYMYFFQRVPDVIDDAARIDGSNEFRTFNTIAVPLMKPAIATQAIFAFIGSWNNFYTPSMILSSQKKYTLPMFVQLMRGERFRSDYGIIYVGLVLTIMPIFIVYFCLSKYIIAGVALGGVKE